MATLTLVDHAFTFLSVYREQHVSRRPSQPLPRVSLSLQRQQPSSGYSVCQARLWEALLTHALSPLQTAKYFLECLFANSTICSLQAHTASNLPVICYFESHVLTEPIRVAFAACSRAILHDFLLPLKNKHQTPAASHESPTKRTRTQKDLCRSRDGTRSVITGHYDRRTPADQLPDDVLIGVDLELAHIIPFSVADKPEVHRFITLFSGGSVTAGTVAAASINHTRNGILLQSDAHRDFDNYRWSVHCPAPGVYRAVRIHPGRLALSFILPQHDLQFGAGTDGGDGGDIEMPSPELFNLHMAIGRVLYMSGAGETIEKVMRDQQELKCGGAWMDGSETASTTLDMALTALGLGWEWGKTQEIEDVCFAEVNL